MHQLMASTLDTILRDIQRIKADASRNGVMNGRLWPMIVLRSPKGWTARRRSTASAPRTTGAPPGADGRDAREAGARSDPRKMDEELQAEELFDKTGKLIPEARDFPPKATVA
jgi:xylulose-5-phosphate/fructose-6-phosphate phosphoketolase